VTESQDRATQEKVRQAEEAAEKEKKGGRGAKRADDKAFANEIDRKPCDPEDEMVLISDLGEGPHSFPNRLGENQLSHVRAGVIRQSSILGVGLMISTAGSTRRINRSTHRNRSDRFSRNPAHVSPSSLSPIVASFLAA